MKISEVKDKIYQMTGTPPPSQDITLVRSPTSSIVLSPENATLADFGAANDMDINVIDRNPYSVLNVFSSTNQQAKYVMSDEDYDKYPGTVRAFKREKFQNDPVYRQQVIDAQQKRERAQQEELTALAQIKVGNRCKVVHRDAVGTVKWIGSLEGKAGLWVGVELDLPVGNCAGEDEGTKYFECCRSCGMFAKPQDVTVGDYAQLLDIEDSDEL